MVSKSNHSSNWELVLKGAGTFVGIKGFVFLLQELTANIFVRVVTAETCRTTFRAVLGEI